MVADLPSMSHCVTQKHTLAPVVGSILYPLLRQKKMLKGGLHSKLIGQCAFPKSGWLPGELFWEGGPGASAHRVVSGGSFLSTQRSLEGASPTLLVTLQFLSPERKMRKPKTKNKTR